MLTGDKVVLRPVRERDLAACIDAHTEISNRGAFFPLGVQSEPALRRKYAETGSLGAGCGHPPHLEPGRRHGRPHRVLLTVNYWDAYELSDQLYGQEHAGQGYDHQRDAVDLLCPNKSSTRRRTASVVCASPPSSSRLVRS